MPIYEYRCEACGHETDELQKLADSLLVDCPKCGKPALVRLVSAAGFHLKGTGWYQTDFKTQKKGSNSDTPKPDAAPAGDATKGSDSTKSTPAPSVAPPATTPAGK